MAAAMAQPLQLPPSQGDKRAFAQQLRQQTLACRVRHGKPGVRRALTREQIREVAEEFGADSAVLTAAKKILDTKDPAFRAAVKVRRQASMFWKSMTTPYPEPGVRLIRKGSVEMFDRRMTELAAELNQAAAALQENYAELRQKAAEQLGTLFNPGDYPTRIDGEFSLDWDYPSIEPPAFLKDLHPQLYEQECERIRGRLEEAVRLTEQAFTEKFHDLVAHLVERLRGDVDGKPKVFRDTAIANLTGFFDEFRQLDFGSSAQLQHLVDQAQQAVNGITPDDLRAGGDVRARVAEQLAQVEQAMEGLMVARPNRAIRLEDE